jgi:hypothetical protein
LCRDTIPLFEVAGCAHGMNKVVRYPNSLQSSLKGSWFQKVALDNLGPLTDPRPEV